jgi:hypothetical protein
MIRSVTMVLSTIVEYATVAPRRSAGSASRTNFCSVGERCMGSPRVTRARKLKSVGSSLVRCVHGMYMVLMNGCLRSVYFASFTTPTIS